jgi:hypothetical protein
MRGCDEGIRDLLEVEADGDGRVDAEGSELDGPAGKVVAPLPGGFAIGNSGLTGLPFGGKGGGTTTTPGG